MSVGKYLPGASFSIFAVRDDVVQCKMNSYWSTLVLKVCLAPPPIIDKRYVLNTRQCSAVQWSNYWSNLSTHENVNWYRSDLLTHFAFLFRFVCRMCWDVVLILCVFSTNGLVLTLESANQFILVNDLPEGLEGTSDHQLQIRTNFPVSTRQKSMGLWIMAFLCYSGWWPMTFVQSVCL